MSNLEAKTLKLELVEHMPEVAEFLLPNGQEIDLQWTCGSPKGEPGKSLKLELYGDKVGLWNDFAAEEGGDIFDLWQITQNVDFKTACQQAKDFLMQFAESGGNTPKLNGKTPPTAKKRLTVAKKTKAPKGQATEVACWDYFNAAGTKIGFTKRLDYANGDKEVLPYFKKKGSYFAPGYPDHMKNKRPLYGDLPKEGGIIITEGEKAADAVRFIGAPTCTSSGGAGSAKQADWSRLKGVKNAIIWRDNDDAGIKYARDVAEIIGNLEPGCVIKVLCTGEEGKKHDAVDWVQLHFADWNGYTPEKRLQTLKSKLQELINAATPLKDFLAQTTPPIKTVSSGTGIPEKLPKLDIALALSKPPPPRLYLFTDKRSDGFFPAGEGCGMAAPGGAGKSLLAIQISLSLTSGMQLLDAYNPNAQIPVFFFTKEDSGEELWRRVWDIQKAHGKPLKPVNLKVYPLLGIDFPLTKYKEGEFVNGAAVDRIIDIVNKHGGSGLAILDPIRKMTAGEENGAAMSAVIHACDTIRLNCTGSCTTLLLHHSSKDSVKARDVKQTAFRGATDLVDGLRWTLILSHLNDTQRGKLPNGNNWRRLTTPKSNYTAANISGVFLEWEAGRFVARDTPDELLPKQSITESAEQLRDLLTCNGSLTVRQIRENCNQRKGAIFCSQKDHLEVIAAAKKKNYIKPIQIQKNNGQSYPGWTSIEVLNEN